MDENQTIILAGGRVEYDLAEASVEIGELIDALERAREDGATHVAMASGNYRGASWASVGTDWSWADDDGGC